MATLITGGAGFVGIEVVRQLLARGETALTVFSRDPSARRLGDLADKVDAISGDVGNFSHVLDAVRRTRPTAIYHLGAMLSIPSDGVKPTPSAGELADAVRSKIPGAKIDFKPDPQIQPIVDGLNRPLDDCKAREEWGWKPTYDLPRMVEDFLARLERN